MDEILAVWNGIPVRVLNVYSTRHEKLASIQAVEGKPFVGGDKWAVKTRYALVDATELEPVEDCNCVLPEQSCDACRLSRMIAYTKLQE